MSSRNLTGTPSGTCLRHSERGPPAMRAGCFGRAAICSCCCGAMYAHQHGTPMLASWGYVGQVDADLCVGCGSCADDCPQEAIPLLRDPTKGEPLEIQ